MLHFLMLIVFGYFALVIVIGILATIAEWFEGSFTHTFSRAPKQRIRPADPKESFWVYPADGWKLSEVDPKRYQRGVCQDSELIQTLRILIPDAQA